MTKLSRTYTSASPEQTRNLGEVLAVAIRPGDVICLWGGLGMGKTTLVQGICNALEVNEDVVSPSFSLINEYLGKLTVYHIDLYRLNDAADIETLGWDEYLYNKGVSFIEWPERAGRLLPLERLDIKMQRAGDNTRLLEMVPLGKAWNDRIGN